MDVISVSDNGCGISASALSRVGQRYNTSKLRSFTDLESVSTLGFRGEAINSICAVAEVSALGDDLQ